MLLRRLLRLFLSAILLSATPASAQIAADASPTPLYGSSYREVKKPFFHRG
jgi:hypothetical protein